MRFDIIANTTKEVRLQRSYRIVRRLLELKRHAVHGVHFEEREGIPKADVNLFMEIVVSEVFPYARHPVR